MDLDSFIKTLATVAIRVIGLGIKTSFDRNLVKFRIAVVAEIIATTD